MRYQPSLLIVLSAMLLGGCGGGSVNSVPVGPVATPTPMAVSVSQPVTASGGTTTATLGSETLSVTAPSGAFTGAATLKITLEAPSAVASTFAKARANARTVQSVPSGATPLAAFIVDAGTATLAEPLTISLSGLTAPASGQTVLISGYNDSAWDDVSGTAFASGAYTETTDPHYPGITLASATVYVIYSVPTANVATPTATVSVAGPATVSAGVPATYTATETTPNGFPFFAKSFTFGVSSAVVGVISAGTTTTSGVLTPAAVGGSGTVAATDAAVASFTGTESVTVGSARPGVAGLSEQYSGTLTEVDANDEINAPTPVTNTTTSATTVAVTSAADAADTSGSTIGTIFTANETDVSSLTTLTSTTASTVLYQQLASGVTDVRLKKTVATESSGVIYENDYTATNGLTTVFPESAGTFTNDASETYLETDPGIGVTSAGQQVTQTKTINADGTYSESILEPGRDTGTLATDTAVENADFSGLLTLNSIDPGEYTITYTAPAGGNITVTRVDPNLDVDHVNTVPSYIPATNVTPSMETDTIATGVALDKSCSNGATYPTANQITQTKSIVDTVFGTVETETATSYDVAGVGTVCTVLADTVESFYDYTAQEGPHLIDFADSATAPLLTTTINETLSLSSTNAATLQSSARQSQSIGAIGTFPVSTFAAHVRYLAHQRAGARMATFIRNSSLVRGGSAK